MTKRTRRKQGPVALNARGQENSAVDQNGDQGLSYEQQRQAKIRQNAARLAELNLVQLATNVVHQKESRATPIKGVKKKQAAKRSPPVPTSRRTRARGLDEESARFVAGVGGLGKEVPNAVQGASPGAESSQAAVEQITVGTCTAVAGLNCDDQGTKEFFAAAAALPGEARSPSKNTAGPKHRPLESFSLLEGNVAKVCKEAVVDMSFMPAVPGSTCCLAVCDKRGQVGLWMHDPHNPNSECALGEDGVMVMQPHRSYASAVAWLDCSTLVSCSYDGTVQRLDVGAQAWTAVESADVDGFSAMGVRDRNTVWLAQNGGDAVMLDIREPRNVQSSGNSALELHDRRINTIHFAPHGAAAATTFVTSSSDSLVKVWDVRAMKQKGKKTSLCPLAELAHTKSCHGAYFDRQAKRIVSTSYDNTVRVWREDATWAAAARWTHNHQTGRWLLPFRAVWGPGDDSVLCGDMGRALCGWEGAEGAAQQHLLRSEFMTAIPSRLAVDAASGVVAVATGSGRVHLWTS